MYTRCVGVLVLALGVQGCMYSGPAEPTVYVSPDFTAEQRDAILTGMSLWNNAGAYDPHGVQLMLTDDEEHAGRVVTPRTSDPHTAGCTHEKVNLSRRWYEIDLYVVQTLANQRDFPLAAAHELGHSIGMEHVEGPAVMQAVNDGSMVGQDLQPNDMAQFCGVYKCVQ